MSAGATRHKRKALHMSIFCQVRPLAQFHDGLVAAATDSYCRLNALGGIASLTLFPWGRRRHG